MKSLFNKCVRFLLKLSLIGIIVTAALFLVYFFNLDMKMTAKMEPVLFWFYDNKVKRDQHL